MANDIDLEHTDAPGATSAPRTPNAVWVNRPHPEHRRVTRPAIATAAAIVLGLIALAGHTAAERLTVVPSAVAGTDAGDAGGNGPTGYFPDRFDRRGLPPAEQPPSF